MRFGTLPLCWALSLSAAGQVSAPDRAAQQAMIARMRNAAINNTDGLQDILCTQSTIRSVDSSGAGKHWRFLETQELELGYIARKEHYRLLSVNGKTTDLEKRVKKGYFIPHGEFGTSLRLIFDPKAAAEFEWDHEESSPRRARVFSVTACQRRRQRIL